MFLLFCYQAFIHADWSQYEYEAFSAGALDLGALDRHVSRGGPSAEFQPAAASQPMGLLIVFQGYFVLVLLVGEGSVQGRRKGFVGL